MALCVLVEGRAGEKEERRERDRRIERNREEMERNCAHLERTF